MSFSDMINYTLIETKDFSITVFEVLSIVVVFLVTYLIILLLKRLLSRRRDNRFFDIGRSHAILQILKYLLWIFAILIALQILGIKITLLLAGSAALLVGLGLGLQGIFQDIMSGITIMIEGIIKVDDIVEIEDGIIGKVVEVDLRTSKIKTRDDIIMIIPNSRFVTDNVINWSHMQKKTRFSVNVGVAYGSDTEKVTKLLLESVKTQTNVLSAPAPFVRFNNFGESSLDFQVFFWTTDTFRVEDLKSDIRYEIDKAFRINGVRIPFPQRDLHIKSEK